MKRGMEVVKAFALRAAAGFLLLFLGVLARGQDVTVNCSQNPTCQLTPSGGLPWANGNLVWIFKPINPHVSIYIFIRNQNPSSAHTQQTVTVWQTPFSHDIAPTLRQNSSRWTQDTLIQNSTVNASCNAVALSNDSSPGASGLGSCYVVTVFAAQVAIQITGAVTQAGSPDNFDLSIVQETGVPAGQTPSSSTSNLAPTPVTGPLQPATTLNSQTTSGANAALQKQVAQAVPGQRVYLFAIAVQASAAATCGITVRDGIGSTVIWTSDASFVTTSVRTLTWFPGLASSVGNGLEVDVSACGTGVTSTLDVQASQL